MTIGRRIYAVSALLVIASLITSPVYAQNQPAQAPEGQTQTPQQTPPPQYQPPTVAEAPPESPTRNLQLNMGRDYSNANPWFPHFVTPYTPVHVAQPDLTNTPRINQLISDGKLMLSLEDAISLGLENNLAVFSHTFTANTQYTQGFATGTQAQVTFDNTRSTSSIPIDLFNPANQSTLTIQITQPLLNGFGRLVNDRYILEGKNTIKVGESQFAQQVITTVTQVATDYWELVFARENVKVEQVAVAADQQLYENNKKQLEIGTMAPLDVITAQSQLATDQQALVQAQTTQLLDETTLLVAITKDPLVGQLSGIEVVPTSPIFNPAPVSIPLGDAVQEAWKNRPELQQAELNLKNAGIEIKATKNALLPTVNLFGEYSATGLGGIERKSSTTTSGLAADTAAPIVDATGTPVPGLFEPSAITALNLFAFPGGYGDDLNRLFNARYPTFEGGINFTLPIRNRAAEAANATAQLNQRQQLVEYRQTQSTIVLNVRQALITLEQDRAAIAAAEQARTLQQQSYDDEVKRLQLGTSTAFTVIQKQQLLTAAEGVELRDRINLIEAELTFNQAMGRTLDVHHIIVAGAGSGSLYHTPNIPGTPDADGLQAHQ